MFGRKTKPTEAPSREGRQVQGHTPAPAFSYYTARNASDVVRERTSLRDAEKQSEKKGRQGSAHSALARLPFWLFVAVVMLCTGKVLLLTTDPKVVVLGQSSVNSSYAQPTSTYAAAAHRLLARSPANHTKLTADLDGTAAALQAEFPELQDVSLEARLVGSRPILYVQVTQPSLVLQTTHGNFALNSEGITLARLQKLPSDIPLLVDQAGTTPRVSKQALPSGTVAFVRTVAYQLHAAGLHVSAFTLPADKPFELDVRFEGKTYYVRYNLEADAPTQSGATIATLQQLGTHQPAEYLDVRTPGRVYYK